MSYKKKRLIFSQLVKILCIVLMIVYLCTTCLSISLDSLKRTEDKIPTSVYFIETAEADTKSDWRAVINIENENAWDFSTKLREHDYKLRIEANYTDSMIKAITDEQKISELQKESSLLKQAATECLILGIVGYVIIICCWLSLVFELVVLFVYLKSSREKIDKLPSQATNKISIVQPLLTGLLFWTFLVLVQCIPLSTLNTDVSFLYYQVVFAGGMHCWIPTVGLTLLSFVGQSVVHGVLKSPASAD